MTPFTKLTQAIIYIHNVSHLLSVVWPLAVLVQGIFRGIVAIKTSNLINVEIVVWRPGYSRNEAANTPIKGQIRH